MNRKFLLTLLSLTLLYGLKIPCFSQALASTGGIEVDSKVRFQIKTLHRFLIELEEKFKVSIVADMDLIQGKTVKDNRKFNSAEAALDATLKEYNLKYDKVEDKVFVIISPANKADKELFQIEKKSFVPGQKVIENNESLTSLNRLDQFRGKLFRDFPVKGRVISSISREPLPGVSIVVKGTSVGTVTDAQGNYTLNVTDQNSILIFSYIGYLSEEVSLNGRGVVDLSLTEDIKTLSEVVVIGYGTQSRKDITGAISSVGGQELTQVPAIGLDQALQGRAAGVNITSNSGDPGASASIRIRGLGTIGSNDPLIVLDGVPLTGVNINSINPNDIETVDVLKDASSTAIYGSRAANGVVIITTKKGKKGGTKFTFEMMQGVQNAWRKIPVLNAAQHAEIISEALANSNAQRPSDQQRLTKPANGMWDDFSNVKSVSDWQDALFQNAPLSNYQLSMAGGNEKSTFLISGSYRTQKGIVINSGFERFTFRVNTEHSLGSRIRIGENITFANSKSSNRVSNNEWDGVLVNSLVMPEAYPVYNDTAQRYSVGDDLGQNLGQFYGGDFRNPIRQAATDARRDVNNRITGNVYGTLNIIKGLSFRSDLGLDLNLSAGKRFEPSYRTTSATPSGNPTKAILNNSSVNSFVWNWDNTLTFSRTFAEKHNLTLLLGTSAQEFRLEGIFAGRIGGFPSNDLSNRYLGIGNAATQTNGSYASTWSLFSTFARLAYDYNKKYLITATVRRDGSSKFLGDNKYGVFPSAALGWVVSEEGFMQNVPVLSFLKIRGSWGETGNQSVGSDFPFFSAMFPRNVNYALGGQLVTGMAPLARGNRDLRWETVTQKDLGVEIGLLEDKIFLTADYYDKLTSGMLVNPPIPSIGGGAAAPYVNAGSVSNKGVELGISFEDNIGDFRYRIAANGSYNKNSVTSLGPVQYINPQNAFRGGDYLTRTQVGHPVSAFYGYQTIGLFQSKDEVGASPVQNSGTSPGDLKFKDIAGPPDENGKPTAPDGIIDANDRTIIGSGIPKYNYGFNISANYKNFDFSLFLQGVADVQVLNSMKYYTENVFNFSNGAGNKVSTIYDRWTPENTNTSVPRVTYDDPNQNQRFSDRYVENGAYMRVKSVQLGYNLPQALLSRVGLNSFRIYLSSQNLFTFTKYSGFDPEIGINQNDINDTPGSNADALRNFLRNQDVGVDRGVYPQSRVFLLGINVGF